MQCINNQKIIIVAPPLSLNDSGTVHPSSSSSSTHSHRYMLVPMRLSFVCITFPAFERYKIFRYERYTFLFFNIVKSQIFNSSFVEEVEKHVVTK